MAKDIQWMGAIFPDVPSITLPQQGGGLASFDDTSDGDIQPADVAQGKIGYAHGQRVVGTAVAPSGSQTFTENGTYNVTSIAEAVINVAGGGGSRCVVGNFTAQSTAGSQTIQLDYTGSGYPMLCAIIPKGGTGSDNPIKSAIRQNAIVHWYGTKYVMDTTPTYDGTISDDNRIGSIIGYKTNGTNATRHTYANGGTFISYEQNANASSGMVTCVVFNSPSQMQVYVVGQTGTAYGFLHDIEYTYFIVYSS